MTEKEIIKALKENEKAYHFMDPEMQAWAIVHKKDMRCLWDSEKWHDRCDVDCVNMTYRLRPDYPEEPEKPDRIEIEIVLIHGDYCVEIQGLKRLYTAAPALVPKKGYRFIGFRWKELGEEFRADTLVWINKDGCLGFHAEPGYVPTRPITAVYERRL